MPPIDTIASIATLIMSTIVACVALLFSFRQNVGWRPVALVAESSMSGTGGRRQFTLHASIEFWNRRKYPVVVRSLSVAVTGLQIRDSNPSKLDGPHVRGNSLHQRLGTLVEPNESGHFPISVHFEDQSLDAMQPFFAISLSYFDPYSNRLSTLKLSHRFFYPEMGWMKSPEERAKITAVFNEILEEERRQAAKGPRRPRRRTPD